MNSSKDEVMRPGRPEPTSSQGKEDKAPEIEPEKEPEVKLPNSAPGEPIVDESLSEEEKAKERERARQYFCELLIRY